MDGVKAKAVEKEAGANKKCLQIKQRREEKGG